MTWAQISFEVDAERCDDAERVLEAAGALSVTYGDPGDDPILEPAPGEQPLWERIRLTALFDPREADPAALRDSVGRMLGTDPPGWTVEHLEDRVWERAWMDHFEPIRFGGRLWIVPSHREPPDPQGINVRMDPGLAFGTGTHPTTALCLEWLAEQDLTGLDIVDYGCGSGILAVAALKLGARSVLGVDNDPQALEASRLNAAANDVEDRLDLTLSDRYAAGPADVVLANILANVLVELRSRLVAAVRPGGRIVLSGILESQATAVAAAFEPEIVLEPPRHRGDWVCLAGMRA